MTYRREFLKAALAAATVPSLCGESEWGSSVIDIHLHPRRGPEREIDHVTGCGANKAVLLPGAEDRAKAAQAENPNTFLRFTNADVRTSEAVHQITAGLKGGAIGVGELKYPVQVDGPEMRRVYEVAAEFRVPVLLHFEEGNFNSGFERLPALLKSFPRTNFIGHGQSWWAHISSETGNVTGYPAGPVKPGGLSDRLLADHANMYGDLSANSGRNALARDAEFAGRFLQRHRTKLMFGSDCPCLDGHGGGQRATSPAGKDKCIARETLGLMQKLASPELFRTIAWDNAVTLLKLKV